MNRYCAPCILPYAICVYKKAATPRRPMAFCDDIRIGPGNSDAKCFKVTWKKQMIERSLDSGVGMITMKNTVAIEEEESSPLEGFLENRGYLVPDPGPEEE